MKRLLKICEARKKLLESETDYKALNSYDKGRYDELTSIIVVIEGTILNEKDKQYENIGKIFNTNKDYLI